MIPKTSLEQVDIEAILAAILRNAVKALGGGAGVVATWNEARRCFMSSASCGLESETLNRLHPLLEEIAPDLAGSRISFDFLSQLLPDMELPVSSEGIRSWPCV
jgi:hypothetical protein